MAVKLEPTSAVDLDALFDQGVLVFQAANTF